MPKGVAFSRALKRKAKKLFLEGFSTSKIVAIIKKQDNIEVSDATIKMWSMTQKWSVERGVVVLESMQNATEEVKTDASQRIQEQLSTLQNIQHAGIKALFKKEHPLEFKRAPDAVSAILNSAEAEREIIKGLLYIQFVYDVANIIKEEIQDEEQRKKIGLRLGQLVIKYKDIK